MRLPLSALCLLVSALPAFAQLVPRGAETLLPYPRVDLVRSVYSTPDTWLIAYQGTEAAGGKLTLKTLRWRADPPKWYDRWTFDLYEVALFHEGNEVAYQISGYATHVALESAQGSARLAFSGGDTFVVEAAPGIEVRLRCMQRTGPRANGRAGVQIVTPWNTNFMHFLKPDSGTALHFSVGTGKTVNGVGDEWIATGQAPRFAVKIAESDVDFDEPILPLDVLIAQASRRNDAWMARMPSVPANLQAAAQVAWHQVLAFQVPPAGLITRQALLSSKATWPTRIWAWDNCFHALALGLGDADLGWAQLAVQFDNQFANGALPDPLCDARGDSGFVKPPIHGWTIREMIRLTGAEKARPWIEKLYQPLVRFTEYWMHFRDPDGNGLAHYRHGNDSGWDNATPYAGELPVEGPDLAAYLCIQMDVLGDMAETLGRPEEAKVWRKRSEDQLQQLLARLVVDGRFVTRSEATGAVAPGDCLINCMPLMLGKRLPEPLRRRIIESLRDEQRFLSPNGLASESLSSPLHERDGYWRGPVWAPPNYQLFRALQDAGEPELAHEVARRFTAMCARDAVFWENYEAVSGKGLQAPAVQWTAAVFLLLGHAL
ncbi:amylo-alpha-1,6-glucosidase [Nibricoccus sp. IMCC34717]|uniref:amylo-alpha-1,6-glucosidase n=1 Tax=Nibricoccus sp. IMCC34717 TaxID=3034021 RepID=UPI00384C5551